MRTLLVMTIVASFAATPSLFAQGAGTTSGPNVIVGSLPNVSNWGSSGNIAAFSVGTTSCNIGSQALSWVSGTNQHPVIGQDMYRLKDGVMEQIGQSWLKHGFLALSGSLCGSCQGPGGSQLSPGCSDPYGSGLNGSQGGLGPRSQVNPTTTFFPYPFSAPGAQPTIGRRLQVEHDDLNPALNSGALYFVSSQYIAPGEQNFPGNDDNNVSWRRITVSPNGGSYNISMSGMPSTTRQQTCLDAWKQFVPAVELTDLHVDGHMQFAAHVIDLGGGQWQYEYALFNMNSDRAVGGFSVGISPGTNILSTGFNDVFAHSGEPYSNADWANSITGSSVDWSTDTFASNPNANAIRWGTQYNWRFVAATPPVTGTATLTMFKPGTPNTVDVTVPIPLGGGVAPVTNLTCDTVGFDGAQLNWSNNDTYTAIEITRDGVLIDTIGGFMTSYTDSGLGLGTYEYGVTGVSGSDASFEQTCEVTLEIDPISGLVCDQVGTDDTVELTWVNNGGYDNIEISRDGSVIATILGSNTSYLDLGVSLGFHSYTVEGIFSGSGTGTDSCGVTVSPPPPPTLEFMYEASTLNMPYDPGTGEGVGSITLTATELGTSPGFPNGIGGWAIAVGFDPSIVQATSIDQPADVSGVEFYQGAIWAEGITIGVVHSFMGLTTTFAVPVNSGVVNLEANAATMQGDMDGATTVSLFEDGVHGNPGVEIENVVTVDGNVHYPALVHGMINLIPGTPSGIFVRSDSNDDGNTDIADPVFTLDELFAGGPASVCDDASDANDDGNKDIGDPVFTLNFLFSSGPQPPAPFPACGTDGTTGDALECDGYTSCP